MNPYVVLGKILFVVPLTLSNFMERRVFSFPYEICASECHFYLLWLEFSPNSAHDTSTIFSLPVPEIVELYWVSNDGGKKDQWWNGRFQMENKAAKWVHCPLIRIYEACAHMSECVGLFKQHERQWLLISSAGSQRGSHIVCEVEMENWITSKDCPLLAVMSPSAIEIHMQLHLRDT